MSVRIGVFGGTFDPPHLGHMILAAEACDQLKLDRLLWVLTELPPHKQNQAIHPIQQRLELLQAALRDHPIFELSRVDIDRPGPHYALDTVKLLKKAHSGAELIYLMGGDSLHDLPKWYQPAAFLNECSGLGVMRRPDDLVSLDGLEQSLPGIISKTAFVDAPLLEISSKEIRQRIAEGRPFQYYLLPAVYQLIQDKNLYR